MTQEATSGAAVCECGHPKYVHFAADGACYRCPADGKHAHPFKPTQPAVLPSERMEPNEQDGPDEANRAAIEAGYGDESSWERLAFVRGYVKAKNARPEPVQPSSSAGEAKDGLIQHLVVHGHKDGWVETDRLLDALIEAVATAERERTNERLADGVQHYRDLLDQLADATDTGTYEEAVKRAVGALRGN